MDPMEPLVAGEPEGAGRKSGGPGGSKEANEWHQKRRLGRVGRAKEPSLAQHCQSSLKLAGVSVANYTRAQYWKCRKVSERNSGLAKD